MAKGMMAKRVQTRRMQTKGWTGNTLKFIAVVTMLIDHIGASLIETGFFHGMDPDYINRIFETSRANLAAVLWNADLILRCIGRIAFPLFAYLLVEGFLHTHNLKKYITTCFLFALISEIPFELAFGMMEGEAWGFHNIYFTLTLGLLMMAALRRFGDRLYKQAGIVLLAAAAAVLIHSDYEAAGILIIAAFYLLRYDRRLQYLTAGFLIAVESIALYGAAVLALIPIALYNGERGGSLLFAGRRKYLFYWFYPVHLIILYLIGHAAFGM